MRFFVVGFVSALSVATAALGAAGDGLAIQGSRVNVRANPSTNAPVVLQLDRGDRVVERDRRGAWVNIEVPHHGGRRGWVHRSLVGPARSSPLEAVAAATRAAQQEQQRQQQEQEAGPTTAAAGDRARSEPVPLFEVPQSAAEIQDQPAVEVQAMGARIRGGPTTGSPVIAKVNRGHLLAELDRRGGWVQVRLDDGRVGWIHDSLIDPAERDAPPREATAERTPTAPAPTAVAEAAPTTGGPAAAGGAAVAGRAAAAGERRTAVFAEDRPRLEVAATTVSLRREPSRLAPVVTRLERGSEVVEFDRREDWVEVGVDEPDGARGWVHSSLLDPTGERGATAAAAIPDPAAGTAPPAAGPERAAATGATAEEEEAAAEATRLAITGVRVNIRQGPGTGNRVLMQLGEGDEVREIGRRDDWIQIAVDGGREGWVHESLVRPAPAAGAVATAAPSPEDKAPAGSRTAEVEAGAEPDKFDRFKTTVEHLNERVRRAAGVDVFAEVEDLGDGAVELTATEAWLAAPEAARRANLDTLFRLWDSVHEPDQPIVVRIVDDTGEVAMEKRRDEQQPPTAVGRRFPTAGG